MNPTKTKTNNHPYTEQIESTDSDAELHLVMQQIALNLGQKPIADDDADYFGIAVEVEDLNDDLTTNEKMFVSFLLVANEHQLELTRNELIAATS